MSADINLLRVVSQLDWNIFTKTPVIANMTTTFADKNVVAFMAVYYARTALRIFRAYKA